VLPFFFEWIDNLYFACDIVLEVSMSIFNPSRIRSVFFIFSIVFFAVAYGVTVFILGYVIGSSSKPVESRSPLEFKDFIKEIAIPADVDYNVHSKLLLAEPDSPVNWESSGVEDISLRGILSGAGGVGRRGSIYLSFDGESMSKELDHTVKDRPWGISWVGTYNYVNEIHLETDVDMMFYIDVEDYIKREKIGIPMDLPLTSQMDCISLWYEIKLPGYKPLWMLIDKDLGMHYGTVQVIFVYEKPLEDNSCDVLYPEDP